MRIQYINPTHRYHIEVNADPFEVMEWARARMFPGVSDSQMDILAQTIMAKRALEEKRKRQNA